MKDIILQLVNQESSDEVLWKLLSKFYVGKYYFFFFFIHFLWIKFDLTVESTENFNK